MGQTEHCCTVIGLTGQTGAGKSIVSNLLLNRGFKVIDADIVARNVAQKGEKCLADLSVEFGAQILNSDGTLNRKKLAEIAFSNKDKRMRLNAITHPYILEAISKKIKDMKNDGERFIFLDAPTLFESGADAMCDKVASIIADRSVRIARIMNRDKLTMEEALTRIGAQQGDSFYTKRSAYVIHNNSDLSSLKASVAKMLKELGAMPKE